MKFILALALLCSHAFGAEPVLVISDSGYWILTQDASGDLIKTRVTQVVILGKPNTPPLPPTVPESKVAGLVRELLTKAPVSTAQDKADIANALGTVAELCAKPEGGFETLVQAKATTGIGLRMALKDQTAWRPFGLEFNKLIASLEASGDIKTIADYGKLLELIAKGFKS